MEKEQIRHILWDQGIIAPWYLKSFQFEPYELLRDHRFPFLEMSRRIGKTTTGLVHSIEQMNKKENIIVRWCEPWKDQARKIVIPEIEVIHKTAPRKRRLRFYKTDSFFENPFTGSRLYLLGVNEDKGESARGAFAHLIVADEYGSWTDAPYIRNEVLLPQLLSTDGQLLHTSTPPRNLGHPYYDEKAKSIREGRYLMRDVWAAEKHLYSREQILEMCQAVGGENSEAWKREFLCQEIADPQLLVCPEFSDANIVPDNYPMPEAKDFYMAGDSGHDDNNAFLYAWYDFVKNEVVVDTEYVTNGRTTTEIIQESKKVEQSLWGQVKPFKRTLDANKQLLYDIVSAPPNGLGYSVVPPRKDDKIAAIHELRVEVGGRRFKVKERCRQLIRQLKVGMWKDERHLDFQRSEGLGHLDAFAAGVYLNRSIDRTRNPIGQYPGLSRDTHYIPPQSPSPGGSNEQAFKDLLRRKSRLR